MANNWDKMSRDDYNAIRQNKFNYHNTNDPALREIYHNNNSKIRERYGMTDADDISLGEVDSYIAAAEKKWAREDAQKALLTNLTDYAQNGNARLNASADRVRNFNYDPYADPSYGAYVDMYNRQGQSAAKQTLNNLNAANMGRNSSYGAAATAQVQQAYAQKASEMIPVLEQQAYDRLMNQYNMERQMFNDDFARNMDTYNLIYNSNLMDSEIARNDMATRQAEFDLGMDEKYADGDRKLAQDQVEAGIAETVANTRGLNSRADLTDKEVAWYDKDAQSVIDNRDASTRESISRANLTDKEVAWYDKDAQSVINNRDASTGQIKEETKYIGPKSEAEIAHINANTDKIASETGLNNIEIEKGKIELEFLPDEKRQELELGALKILEQEYLNAGILKDNRVKEIAAQIAEKFGVSREEAEIALTKANTAYTNRKK